MYRMIRSSTENNSVNMGKDDILHNLHLLDDKLRENEMRGEVDIYGGAVMCLALDARESTHDIDAIFAPKTDIRQLIAEVARENDLPADWMNDGVKGFVSEKGKVIPYAVDEFTNLTVCMADPSYLFAMKCLSCRMSYESDTEVNDIKFLANYLRITDVETAEELILQYYPASMYKPKTHYMLEEIFSENE